MVGKACFLMVLCRLGTLQRDRKTSAKALRQASVEDKKWACAINDDDVNAESKL